MSGGNVNDASLRDRVVLITGGSRGLGREMALALGEAGARLCITGRDRTNALLETEKDLKSIVGSRSVLALPADVADPKATEMVKTACLDRFGRIDVLVNNAGRGMRLISETYNTRPAKFWTAEPSAWQHMIKTNINNPFLITKTIIPKILQTNFNKIINISTSNQTIIQTNYSPYGPSKAFLKTTNHT